MADKAPPVQISFSVDQSGGCKLLTVTHSLLPGPFTYRLAPSVLIQDATKLLSPFDLEIFCSHPNFTADLEDALFRNDKPRQGVALKGMFDLHILPQVYKDGTFVLGEDGTVLLTSAKQKLSYRSFSKVVGSRFAFSTLELYETGDTPNWWSPKNRVYADKDNFLCLGAGHHREFFQSLIIGKYGTEALSFFYEELRESQPQKARVWVERIKKRLERENKHAAGQALRDKLANKMHQESVNSEEKKSVDDHTKEELRNASSGDESQSDDDDEEEKEAFNMDKGRHHNKSCPAKSQKQSRMPNNISSNQRGDETDVPISPGQERGVDLKHFVDTAKRLSEKLQGEADSGLKKALQHTLSKLQEQLEEYQWGSNALWVENAHSAAKRKTGDEESPSEKANKRLRPDPSPHHAGAPRPVVEEGSRDGGVALEDADVARRAVAENVPNTHASSSKGKEPNPNVAPEMNDQSKKTTVKRRSRRPKPWRKNDNKWDMEYHIHTIRKDFVAPEKVKEALWHEATTTKKRNRNGYLRTNKGFTRRGDNGYKSIMIWRDKMPLLFGHEDQEGKIHRCEDLQAIVHPDHKMKKLKEDEIFLAPEESLCETHDDNFWGYLECWDGEKTVWMARPEVDAGEKQDDGSYPFNPFKSGFSDEKLQKLGWQKGILKPGQGVVIPKDWHHILRSAPGSISINFKLVDPDEEIILAALPR